jgi:hypothetical protein
MICCKNIYLDVDVEEADDVVVMVDAVLINAVVIIVGVAAVAKGKKTIYAMCRVRCNQKNLQLVEFTGYHQVRHFAPLVQLRAMFCTLGSTVTGTCGYQRTRFQVRPAILQRLEDAHNIFPGLASCRRRYI